MTNNPLFSIVVPAYNSEQFLSMCIRSVLSQSESDFELLIVDDGSSDNTLSILQKLSQTDARIKVFHQENKGHTGARNTGLKNATGEYVLFLDSDDGLEPDVLKQCKNAFQKDSSDIVIFGICQHFGTKTKQFQNLVPDGHYNLQDLDNAVLPNLLMAPNGTFTFPKSLSGKAFRREIINPCQLKIPSDILMGEDGLAFVHAVLLAKSVSVISDVNYLYYLRTDSVSHQKDPLAFSRFTSLLQYYQETVVPLHPCISEQFDRFVIAQLDTATRFLFRSGCSLKQFKKQWKQITAPDYIKQAIQSAKFDQKDKKGRKMKLKHFLQRHQLFWLSKLLLK
ncbi:MAG: glycosyltransferase family 2 protein [Ruminococcaceae bacterium]|nr:glycosyltransferase family 2 protein [Oscillospiraceae bacterium]